MSEKEKQFNDAEGLGADDQEKMKQFVPEKNMFEKISGASDLDDLKNSALEIGRVIDGHVADDEAMMQASWDALESLNRKEELPQLEELKKQGDENMRHTKEEISLELKKAAAVGHLENYIINSPEALLVEMRTAEPKIQNRFNEKINPDMKGAIATAATAFNQCSLPYTLIGSNCYVPHTEHSAKIPDDLDIIFSVKDLGFSPEDLGVDGQPVKYDPNSVYGRLLAMDNVEIVKVEELRKFGKEKNGCVKIKANIKTESGKIIEMEAFAQHMKSDLDAGENTNGIINLGVDKQGIEVIDCNGVKVNIGNEFMAEELYLKNIMNEFPLYDLNGWENKSYLSAKALQRMFNVINLDHENFENSINNIVRKISEIKPPTEAARHAQEVLGNLWDDFKTASHFRGSGLVDLLIDEHDERIADRGPKETKILKTEAAVDFITQESKQDMEAIYGSYRALNEEMLAYKNSDGANQEEMIKTVDDRISDLLVMSQKYKKYIRAVDGDSPRDFCVYAALPRVRNFFIKPVLVEMLKARHDLKNKK